jgi:hypothetical protein
MEKLTIYRAEVFKEAIENLDNEFETYLKEEIFVLGLEIFSDQRFHKVWANYPGELLGPALYFMISNRKSYPITLLDISLIVKISLARLEMMVEVIQELYFDNKNFN